MAQVLVHVALVGGSGFTNVDGAAAPQYSTLCELGLGIQRCLLAYA